jgi:hypothetical protein
MPTNHGIYRKLPTNPVPGHRLTADEAMQFRYGILQIIGALKTGPFLISPDDRQRAAQLEHHFRNVCQRFVFTLQHINGLMQQLVCSYRKEQFPLDAPALNFQAECLADHILTYLNTIVDDIAIVTALATDYSSPDPIDNIAKLRNLRIRNDAAIAPVKTLLDELDSAGSWWELAFVKKLGARQLLVHNQHLVSFQIASPPGGTFEVQAVLMSPFAQNTFACRDFFGMLHAILSNLFSWLDRLEAALKSILRKKSASWSPDPGCPCFLLPVGHPGGITQYEPEYFPIPLCDGSDPLPWSVSVPLT